jgi:hypothetical protein
VIKTDNVSLDPVRPRHGWTKIFTRRTKIFTGWTKIFTGQQKSFAAGPGEGCRDGKRGNGSPHRPPKLFEFLRAPQAARGKTGGCTQAPLTGFLPRRPEIFCNEFRVLRGRARGRKRPVARGT